MLNSKTIGQGENLVLLHGFGFCGDIFKPLIDKYQDSYKIIIIDLPGHGRSNSANDLTSLDDWVYAVLPLIPQNSIILGWSLGGLIAIKLGVLIPVKEIILCASSPKFCNDFNWKFGIKSANFISFMDNININTYKGLSRFITMQAIKKQHITTLKQIIAHNPPDISALNIALNILLTTDLRVELLALKNIRVVLGDKDTIIPATIKNWYKDNNIPVKILDCGHIPFLHANFIL